MSASGMSGATAVRLQWRRKADVAARAGERQVWVVAARPLHQAYPGKDSRAHLTSIFALLHAVVLRRRIGALAKWGMPLILRACATRVRFVRRKYSVWAAMLHRQLRAWLAHHSQRSRTVMRASFEMLSKTLRPLTPSSTIPRSCMSPTTGRRAFRSHLKKSM